MVAAALLQLVLLPVDDDGGDLLVHEQQDGEQDGGYGRDDVEIPGTLLIDQGDQPTPGVTAGGLEHRGHSQLRCGETEAVVNQHEHHDGDDDGVVGDEGPYLQVGFEICPSIYIDLLWQGNME